MRSFVDNRLSAVAVVVAVLVFALGCATAPPPAAQPALVPTPEPTMLPIDVPPTEVVPPMEVVPPTEVLPPTESAVPVPTEPPATLYEPTPTLTGTAGLFMGQGACGVCHALEGLSYGVLGPDLTGIGAAAETRVPGMSAAEYLRESIVDPDAYIVGTADGLDSDYVGGLMGQTIGGVALSDAQVDALVEFLLEQR